MAGRFRYYFKTPTGEYYKCTSAGVVITSTPTPLEDDPLEWRETDLQWARDPVTHGVFRSFVVPMGFITGGATILRHIYNSQGGIESQCIFYIEKQGLNTPEYVFYYSGDVDFSRLRSVSLSCSVAIMDSGLAALLRAKSSVPQEIPITDSEALLVFAHGLRLHNTSLLSLANDPAAGNTWHQMMPTITVQQNESETQVDVIEQPVQQGLGTISLTADHPFFKATIAGIVVINYDISVLVGNSAGSNLSAHAYQMVITHRTAAGTNTGTAIYNNSASTSYVGTNIAKGSISIAVQPDDTIIYYAGLSPFNGSSGSDAFMIEQSYNFSTLSVTYDTTLEPNTIKTLRYITFLQKFVLKMTDNQYTARSDYLSNASRKDVDSFPHNQFITCGDSVRGLGGSTYLPVGVNPGPPAVIKTTFDDVYKDLSSNYMMGAGVEGNVLRFEHLSYFYQIDSVIIDLGEVAFPEVTPALDFIHNQLKVGIQPQQYEALNGRDEPNEQHDYDFPIIRKKSIMDLVSPFRDDMYGIEIHRANLANKNTTDSSSDNDVFVMEGESNPSTITFNNNGGTFTRTAYRLYRPQNNTGGTLSGLSAGDTGFNLTRTPKRKLLRNGALIHTALDQQESGKIVFKTTDKNAEVQCNLGSGNIIEKADYEVRNLAAKLILPVFLTLPNVKVPADIPDLIANNPYGKVLFSARKNGILKQYSGFLYKIGCKPATNDTYNWQLLASADTNRGDLIY